MFRILRKSSLKVKVSKFSIKSEAAIHVYTMLSKSCSENVTEKNLCMGLFSNKVAGLQPEKGICTLVFQ